MRAGCLAAAALTLLAAGRACPNADQPLQTLTLRAQALDLVAGERYAARGSVRLESEGVSVHADALEADLSTGDVSASGQVTLAQDSRRLTGEGLTYNLRSRTGQFERAEARSGLAVVRGREVRLEKDRYVMRQGLFTTCPREPPHFRVTADELIVYPGQRAVARKASFWVRNRRLFTLPEHSFSLAREQAAASGLFPRSGWSRADGLFAGPVYGFAPRNDLVGQAELRFTTHRGARFTSHLSAGRPWGRLALAATAREDLTDRGIAAEDEDTGFADVTLDRLPEVAAHWNRIGLARGLGLTAHALAGRYHESPRGASEVRLDLRALVEAGPFPLGDKVSLGEAISVRPVWYGDGQHRFIWGTTTRIRYEVSRRQHLGVSYFERHTSGSTPFRFDRVDINRGMGVEVATDLTRRWATELEGRYDLREKTFRDANVKLIYRGDCLEYSIGWRKVRGMVNLGVGFPADAFGP